MARALYVILRHDGIAQPHFDLMFQNAPDSLLATWRAAVWPPAATIRLEPLPDHRQAYLTFEGDLSGSRGSVRRVEQGICDVEKSGESWTIRLHPLPIAPGMILQIDQHPDGSWHCTAGATPAEPD